CRATRWNSISLSPVSSDTRHAPPGLDQFGPVPQMIRADYCAALQLFMQAYPPAPFVNSEIRGYSRTAATRLPDVLRGRARRSARPRPRPAAAVRADLGPVPAHRHVTPHPRAVAGAIEEGPPAVIRPARLDAQPGAVASGLRDGNHHGR